MASRARITGKSGLGPPLIDRGKTHVSDVMTSKGNQPAQCADGFRGRLGAIPTSRDEHLIAPNLPQELVRLQTVAFEGFVTGDTRFDGMKVSEVREPLFGLRDQVGEGWLRVIHLHSLPGVPRRDSEPDSVFANGVGDGFDDFEREPGTILNRSTVFVCPLVRDVLQELVWEESVGEVELDAVESGPVDGLVGGNGVPLDVGLDLFDRQRTRSRVGRGYGDGRWANQFDALALASSGSAVRPRVQSWRKMYEPFAWTLSTICGMGG